MANLKLTAMDLDISLPDQSSLTTHAVDMLVGNFMSGKDESVLALSINLCTTEFYRGGGHELTFYIDGYEDIDALRRYCEMTLELFDKGRLG